jgi:tetratricopeptide (TPR) repeat protein
VSTNVFDNGNTATSAMVAIYTEMFSNNESYNMAEHQGLLSDELTSYSTATDQIEFYTNALVAVNSNYGSWNNAYNYIYQANAIIENLQNNGSISPAVAQQLIGESKFVRAFWHFYLTNEYGDVPLVTTTLYTVTENLSRTPQAQVYAQIIQDLKDAEASLNVNYVDATDTAITTERVRPSKGAAEALLARIYLYEGKYDSAESYANLVINNNLYRLCANLSPLMGPGSVFLKNSTEAIWQLSTPLPTPSLNTEDAQDFILISAPGTGELNSTTISPQLLNSFEPGDLRRTNWIDSFQTYYFPYKYQAYNTSTVTEYTMVLRLAEQYLIRAETEAQLNNLTSAANDLNVIRNRAGLSSISDSIASSQTTLLSAILHERQVELFTEWGHRWFDLIRSGTVNSVMGNPENVCKSKGGVWSPTSALYPIPETELAADPNLTQNTGY